MTIQQLSSISIVGSCYWLPRIDRVEEKAEPREESEMESSFFQRRDDQR